MILRSSLFHLLRYFKRKTEGCPVYFSNPYQLFFKFKKNEFVFFKQKSIINSGNDKG